MEKGNLQLLVDAYNQIENALQIIYDVADNTTDNDFLYHEDDIKEGIEEVNDLIWEHISAFVHHPENYADE